MLDDLLLIYLLYILLFLTVTAACHVTYIHWLQKKKKNPNQKLIYILGFLPSRKDHMEVSRFVFLEWSFAQDTEWLLKTADAEENQTTAFI